MNKRIQYTRNPNLIHRQTNVSRFQMDINHSLNYTNWSKESYIVKMSIVVCFAHPTWPFRNVAFVHEAQEISNNQKKDESMRTIEC